LQVLATMAKNLLLLAYGMTLGFPTIVIPTLQNGEEPNLQLTQEQISWFSKYKLIIKHIKANLVYRIFDSISSVSIYAQ
jgi:hypothetical protein